jgi:hypothetical protein
MANKVQSKSLRTKPMIISVLGFCLCFFCVRVQAEGTPAPPSTGEESFEKTFIHSNIAISEWFDGVAEGIDLFLAGKRLTKKKNETSVKLESSTFYKEHENVSNSGSVNVNLRLPNVEEYWQLKFTDYDETKERDTAARGDLRKTPRERNYGATVGLFQKLGNVRMAFQPRVGLQDPLRVSQSLTFESVADVDNYRVNPKLEFFGNPDDGTGTFVALNFNFNISKVHTLTVINDGEYKSKPHVFSATNGISIGQVRTKTTSISYNLYFDSNNREEYHLETYTVSVSWNHLIYKRILDYQLSPYLEFAKGRGFAGVSGVTLTVNLNF